MVVLPNGARLGKGWAGSGYLTEPVESKKKDGLVFCLVFWKCRIIISCQKQENFG